MGSAWVGLSRLLGNHKSFQGFEGQRCEEYQWIVGALKISKYGGPEEYQGYWDKGYLKVIRIRVNRIAGIKRIMNCIMRIHRVNRLIRVNKVIRVNRVIKVIRLEL